MRVVIINAFDIFEDRLQSIYTYFKSKNYDVTVIQSDFRHLKKEHIKESKQNFIYINTKPYYRNLSASRLLSHYFFSKDAIEKAKSLKPDLLYIILPCNSLAKFAALYKNTNYKVKLIFDIMDLWPESLPVKINKKIGPLNLWRNLRDKNLKVADYVITECDLYQNTLKDVLPFSTSTLYLSKMAIDVEYKYNIEDNEINLAYLGSINNIIDIKKIGLIIKEIRRFKSVNLHIIGDGEKTEEFIQHAKDCGAAVNYYGKIYNANEKQSIFNKCNFGLNIMKDSVSVGLTMKSIDYFQHGLPIINNIPYDTEKIVRDYNVGYNVMNNSDLMNIQAYIQNSDTYVQKNNAVNVYEELFSFDRFNEKMDEVLSKLSIYS